MSLSCSAGALGKTPGRCGPSGGFSLLSVGFLGHLDLGAHLEFPLLSVRLPGQAESLSALLTIANRCRAGGTVRQIAPTEAAVPRGLAILRCDPRRIGRELAQDVQNLECSTPCGITEGGHDACPIKCKSSEE